MAERKSAFIVKSSDKDRAKSQTTPQPDDKGRTHEPTAPRLGDEQTG